MTFNEALDKQEFRKAKNVMKANVHQKAEEQNLEKVQAQTVDHIKEA